MDTTGEDWGALVVSPDGRKWSWSHIDVKPAPDASTLEVGGLADPTRVAMHRQGAASLEPIWWSDTGVAVELGPLGVCGTEPDFFPDHCNYDALVIDRATLAQHVLTDSTKSVCPLNDFRSDGTIVCATPDGIRVTKAEGSSTLYELPAKAFQVGDAFFDAAGAHLSLGVNVTAVNAESGAPANWDVRAYVMDVTTRTWTRVGLPGSVPYGWLPDGSLVLGNVAPPFRSDIYHAHLLSQDGQLVDLGRGQYLGALNPDRAIATRALN
jgi:hypothetical protein